jgi:hypothetical protein
VPVIVTGVIAMPLTAVMPAQEAVTAGGGAIVMVQFVVIVPTVLFGILLESAARTLKVNVPAAVGVPVMAPVAGLSVKPAGSAPETIE